MTSFMGYERADGTVGIRNHVVAIPSVSCANGVVASIARQVPEIVPMYHASGCGRGGEDLIFHSRALQNLGKNPNIAGLLVIGLGCEIINAESMALMSAFGSRPVERVMIQEAGGSGKAAQIGVSLARKMIDDAQKIKMQSFSIDKLTVGLECGGSDAFSGITANPAVGFASDWLIEQGATVILTETTEMIGASHILERRAASNEVKEKIKEIVSRTEAKTHEVLGPMAGMAISPGNMDGGMSSIREKSLGCIVKAGSTPVNQVIDYAEIPTEKGLVIMHGPGYDTESMTGLAAGGAQIILFTTGMGNPIGFPAVPVIKIASTSRMFNHMEEDMDINAGVILEGESIEKVGERIQDTITGVIKGIPAKAETNKQDGLVCLYTQTTSF